MSSDPPMADGLNWYRYANNNPIMYSDPSGLSSEANASVDPGFSIEFKPFEIRIKIGKSGGSSSGGDSATAPVDNGGNTSTAENNEGTGDSNTANPPTAEETPGTNGTDFHPGEPKQTDKPRNKETGDVGYSDSCYFFAMAASIRALGFEPPSGAIDTDWGDEIRRVLIKNGWSHQNTAIALFGVNFTFHSSGDLRWRDDNDDGVLTQRTTPCDLGALPEGMPGVIVFKQSEYWNNGKDKAEHAISIIRNADGTFSVRDPYNGNLVDLKADPNDSGYAYVNGTRMQIIHLYWFQPPKKEE